MKEKLNKIRKEIDSLDKKLLSVLEERLELVSKVADIKTANKNSYIKADREALMMGNLLKLNKKLPAQIIIQIWRLIISMSLHHEVGFKVYAATKAKFHNQSIRDYFSSLTEIVNFLLTKKAIAEFVNSENNTDVLVADVRSKSLYRFLLKNEKYKIFAKLPFDSDSPKKNNLFAVTKIDEADLFEGEKLFCVENGLAKKLKKQGSKPFLSFFSGAKKYNIFIMSQLPKSQAKELKENVFLGSFMKNTV